MLSLSLPSDLFVSKLDVKRKDVLGSARRGSGASLRVPEGLAQVAQLRWKGKPGLSLRSRVVLTSLLLTLVGEKGMSASLISACPRKT